LLDDLHGFEGIDLRVFALAEFCHQSGVHILAVGDGGLGDAAPQLLHVPCGVAGWRSCVVAGKTVAEGAVLQL